MVIPDFTTTLMSAYGSKEKKLFNMQKQMAATSKEMGIQRTKHK
jgi:hypothetical protein